MSLHGMNRVQEGVTLGGRIDLADRVSMITAGLPAKGEAKDASSWSELPVTKFRPPHLRPELAPRHALVARIAAAMNDIPVTLVVAGAGYGKTSTVAMATRCAMDRIVSWVSLDREDDDASRFIAVLIASIENALPGAGAAADAAFARTTDPLQAWQSILDVLINAVAAREEKIVVIFDDLHLVSSWIYRLLGYLIERLPANLHLVFITRDDPPFSLGRWRAAKVIAEFRRADLRFDAAEIRSVTAAAINNDPPQRVIERIEERTDGWPACVVLVASALAKSYNRDALLDRIDGRNRITFEFLSAEVFDGLTDLQREFLLRISILDDLAPALCEAVSGRADAFEILQTLYAKGAFLTAIDDEERVFRLNDLFRSFLRETLSATKSRDEIRAMHLVVGRAEQAPDRAIEHFIQAEEWEAAHGGQRAATAAS